MQASRANETVLGWNYQFKVDDLENPDGKFSVLLMGFGDKLYFGSPADVAQGCDPDAGRPERLLRLAPTHCPVLPDFSDGSTLRFTPSLGYDSIGFAGNSFVFDQVSWLTGSALTCYGRRQFADHPTRCGPSWRAPTTWASHCH